MWRFLYIKKILFNSKKKKKLYIVLYCEEFYFIVCLNLIPQESLWKVATDLNRTCAKRRHHHNNNNLYIVYRKLNSFNYWDHFPRMKTAPSTFDHSEICSPRMPEDELRLFPFPSIERSPIYLEYVGDLNENGRFKGRTTTSYNPFSCCLCGNYFFFFLGPLFFLWEAKSAAVVNY